MTNKIVYYFSSIFSGKDRVLTLSGERNYDNEVKEENYYRRERTYGKFQRAFSLPADVDSDKIKADFKDGLLKIEVPKPEKQKPKGGYQKGRVISHELDEGLA